MTRSHTSARKPPGTTAMRLIELFGPKAARSRASSELRSTSCGNHPRARRATMTTTTPKMRKTTVRFLNGLSRGAYVIILPRFPGEGDVPSGDHVNSSDIYDTAQKIWLYYVNGLPSISCISLACGNALGSRSRRDGLALPR